MISTAYALATEGLAADHFSRWCQENFFRYMMENQRNALENKLRYRKSPLCPVESSRQPRF